jgi:hypothetical protein
MRFSRSKEKGSSLLLTFVTPPADILNFLSHSLLHISVSFRGELMVVRGVSLELGLASAKQIKEKGSSRKRGQIFF